MTKKEFELILQEGEGDRIEFKESLDKSFAKELVAFANAGGGRIFLGVTDKQSIKETKYDNRLAAQIQDIANGCDPKIEVKSESYDKVVVVHVKEGKDKPYKCSDGFFLRVGPVSQKLSRDEIVRFIKSEGKVRFEELTTEKYVFQKHYDPQKLRVFLSLAEIEKKLDDPTILDNLSVLQSSGGKHTLNNTGILFFTKKLYDIYEHTAITCVTFNGTERIDVVNRKEFNEDVIDSINEAIRFVKHELKVSYDMKGKVRREEVYEIPIEAIREAIVNAVSHRDYFERGAHTVVEIFDDRIEISNPGGLVKGLSSDDFGKKAIRRNPLIASMLHRTGFVENLGTGINKIKTLVRDASLPRPEFRFNNFFTIVLKRPITPPTKALRNVTVNVTNDVTNNVTETLGLEGKRLARIVQLLQSIDEKYFLSIEKFARQIGAVSRTVKRDIDLLKKEDIIVFRVAPKKGSYQLTEKGKVLFKRK